MDFQEQDIALLEDYLAGELAGEDLRACEARLQAEPELTMTLEMLRSMGSATQASAQDALKQEMRIAKAAAIAAGMVTYNPTVNAPSGNNFLGGLLKFLITLGITGLAAWFIWKYVLQGQLPWALENSTTTKTETHVTSRDTTITRDTIRSHGSSPKRPAQTE
jgi:hypothetical protein